MTSHPVLQAILRWEEKELLSPGTADTLRAEVEEERKQESQKWAQYFLAGTGGAILIIAGTTFLSWAWPSMGPGGQSLTLGVIGLAALVLGLKLPASGRWAAVAYLLQLAGPILVFAAIIHSREAWPDATLGGIAAGSVGLLLPLVLVPLALRQHAALGALQGALAFLLLYGFFSRGLGLPEETFLWILDGILVAGLALLGNRLRDPEGPDWAMPMFASLCFTGFVLLAVSGEVAWDLETYTIVPLDVWLLIVAGLAYWGQQDTAPPHLRREWFDYVLALSVLVGIPFGFLTTLEALHTSEEVAALTVGAVGGMGLAYSLPRESRVVLAAACVALLIAAWYYGAEKGGALGSVLALAFMAVLLFWGSSRVGTDTPSQIPPETE